MANKNQIGLHNGDLSFDIEKIKGYDKPKIKKDEYDSTDELAYVIEVNDNSYFYVNRKERDEDFVTLKKLLAGQTVLKLDKVGFVKFMTDEGARDINNTFAQKLIKKGSFTIEDLLDDCAYIPSNIIKNKSKVPSNLQFQKVDNEFEVNPRHFIVVIK